MDSRELSTALVSALHEQTQRQQEALRMYRPLWTQVPFHATRASEVVLRGGNRSGKTTSGAVQIASACTGIPVSDPEGNPLPMQFPQNRPLVIWAIGYDESHIGRKIFGSLFKPGQFKIIRDPDTREWRAWQPWLDYDRDHEHLTKHAPPLISKSFYNQREWAWIDKRARVFSVARLRSRWPEYEHGTEIYAMSSKAEVKMGDAVDIVWIDEDIATPEHVSEYQARLSDNRGRLYWTAFPLTKNQALRTLTQRAKEDADIENPDVSEFILKFTDNPYIPDDEKRKRLKGWSDQEAAARDRGEYQTADVLMYPNFDEHVHCTPAHYGAEFDSGIDTVIRRRGGVPPDHWTRYLVLDPGHARPAVILAAIPPPGERLSDYHPEFAGDHDKPIEEHVVVYDEVYARNCDAKQLASLLRPKMKGYAFHEFIIDAHAARITPMGFGMRVEDVYINAFDDNGLVSAMTGSGFTYGSDNVSARINMLRDWLHIRHTGTPILKIVVGNCPRLVTEFALYNKQMTNNEYHDKPVAKDCDCIVALEYLAASEPSYYPPGKPIQVMSPAYKAFQEWTAGEEGSQKGAVWMGPAVHNVGA